MYNRYVPEQETYTWVGAEGQSSRAGSPSQEKATYGAGGGHSNEMFRSDSSHSQRQSTSRRGSQTTSFTDTWSGGGAALSALLSGKGSSALSGLKKSLKLEKLDTGDILLLLIILYLLVEGEDLDLVIALGLVLLMGLGEDKKRGER